MHKQLRFPGTLCEPRASAEYRQEIERETDSQYVESHQLSFHVYEDATRHAKRWLLEWTTMPLYLEESRDYIYVGFTPQNVYPKIVIVDIFRKVKGI